MNDSRLPGFYRRAIGARIDELQARGFLAAADADALKSGRHLLDVRVADKMIENVIATFSLPLAIAPNLRVDGRDYVVPMVVEEPSVVAALAAAAQLARSGDGFVTSCEESLAIGQVHLRDVPDPAAATAAINADKPRLIEMGNAVHPRLLARGGGVRDIELRELELSDGSRVLAVHLLVDSCDAMGANLVNTICEALAPALSELAGGKVVMCILSNLVDRSIVRAKVRIRVADLDADEHRARRACDAIVLAAGIARTDPYRAATHNKGIMNGIDPIAIATGNDWRAIEAGAHAFAARGGRYTALSDWSVTDDGDLAGSIELPLKVGVVGGTLEANAAARIGLAIAGVESAGELARLMAAAGLAQNFSALRALGTTGIQHGHMRLHARSVAVAAGVPETLFETIVGELIESGEIKDWKARELLLRQRRDTRPAEGAGAAGKLILFGEHAVVYGRSALALPIRDAVRARARASDVSTVVVPEWQIDELIDPGSVGGRAIALIAGCLGLREQRFELRVSSSLPRGMGLGSSAAFAVAVTRALGEAFGVDLDDERVNDIAFECEKLAHGTPSGVDNTIATFAKPLLYRRGAQPQMDVLDLAEVPPIVIACSNSPGSTFAEVAGVRERRAAQPARFESLFDEIEALTSAGREALLAGDYEELGALMNICHGLLNAIGVSTPEIEHIVAIAREHGAAGAKLTGAGGGGSVIALSPGRVAEVAAALSAAGFRTISLADAGEISA